ncbi:Metallophosphoesterase [Desulfonema limicola]|uniref:Metallophosphoesterase n=1 Tax=Desulfonema limicola TaxID=45656 RepID=A0A975B858_9BACT|nr:metallophosphoesterase family protein [Desulfonema limicola]QTA80432.1 Metallophosphoesterase [Desulfonema limicola]
MRLAVFSDIHSNLEALEAFIDDALHQMIHHYFCLGDIVGYGANPNQCIQKLQTLPNLKCVLGNHDYYASKNTTAYDMSLTAARAIIWTKKRLSKENTQFLKALKPILKTTRISFSHAAPHNPLKWQYIFTSESASRSFFSTRQKIIFNGHTHVPQIITQKICLK